MDRIEYARQLRDAAATLLEVAAKVLEGPRTAATTRARGCTCDACGDHVAGLQWVGDPCESLGLRWPKVGGCSYSLPCPGRYRLDPEPAKLHVHHRGCYDDAGPGAGGVSLVCGLTTSDPEPDDGLDLTEMAWQQAVRDFVHGDDEAFVDMAEFPGGIEGIASTFGGRKSR